MTMRIRLLSPSGDTSGVKDRQAINTLIQQYTNVSATHKRWTIVLDGDYYFDEPIVNDGVVGGVNKQPVDINGACWATWNYVGPRTSAYALTMRRQSNRFDYTQRARLANIMFDCKGNARGAYVRGMQYGSGFRNLTFRFCREVALDVIDCWESRWDSIGIHYCFGLGLRVRECASAQFHNIMCDACCGFRHITNNLTLNRAMWLYECANGRDAALVEYGGLYDPDTNPTGLYEEAWPATNDTSVQAYNGVVQLSEAQRALVHVRSNYTKFLNVSIEGNGYGEKPLVCIATAMRNQEWDGLYFENNRWKNEAILLAAAEGVTSADGNIAFRRHKSDGTTPTTISTFIRTTGTVSNVSVSDYMGYDTLDAIITCDGGALYDSRCSGIRARNNAIEPANWIRAINGGTVSNDVPYSLDHTQIAEAEKEDDV